jgi:hypothetical protein
VFHSALPRGYAKIASLWVATWSSMLSLCDGDIFPNEGVAARKSCTTGALPPRLTGRRLIWLPAANRQRRRPSRSASRSRMRRVIATVAAYVESMPSKERRRLPSVRARVYGVSEA